MNETIKHDVVKNGQNRGYLFISNLKCWLIHSDSTLFSLCEQTKCLKSF